jgi:predicted small lipoprotein YifL
LLARLALVAALAAALAGCGRKGPLEPPPSAAITAPPAGAAGAQRYDAAGKPTKPAGQRKTFLLDWLLN